MPSEGGIIAGYGIFVLLVGFLAFFLYKRGSEIKQTLKVTLHCETCNSDETFTNMLDSEFKDVYTCPRCGNPRKLIK